ncbi:MAG: ATP-binding protein [Chloroflexota bacterium]
MDPLTIALEAAYFGLFGATLGRYARTRTAVDRDIVLVFGTTAALFAISILTSIAPALGAISPLSVAIFLAQPWLIVRLVRHFRPIAGRVEAAAFAVFVASSLLNWLGGGRVLAVLIFIIVAFVVFEAFGAIELWRESRRHVGVSRWRLVIASFATVMFALTIFIAGAGAAATQAGRTVQELTALSRLTALAAALGYVVAFVTPRFLTSIPHRATAFGLSRDLVSAPSGTDAHRLWDALAARAVDVLGARTVAVVAGDPPAVVAIEGEAPPAVAIDMPVRELAAFKSDIVADDERTSRVVDLALMSGSRSVGRLVAVVPGSPLFVDDDLDLVALLGSMTARAIERDAAMAELAQTREALAESRARQASELRFRAVLDEHPSAVLVTAEDGRILFANRIAGELFRRPVEELTTLAVDDLVPAAVREKHADHRRTFRERPTRRAMGMDRNLTAVRSDGTSFPVEVALSPFPTDEGLLTIAVVSDITERRAAEELRETFLGMLSHELRTPVTAIYGGSQLLLNRLTLPPAKSREILEDVAAEAERLHRMIENLLVLARVERGGDLTGRQPILLRRVLPMIVDRERTLWPGIDLRISIPPDIPVVSADDDSLGQIIRNLLSNAAKYAGSQGPIELSVGAASAQVVEIVVRDHGPGFDPADAERLFDLYFRSEKTAAAAPGAGIGLFVCRKLAEAMGGRLTATTPPGGGAAFTLALPVYVEDDSVWSPESTTEVTAVPEPSVNGTNGTSAPPAHVVTVVPPRETTAGRS